jgi:hypothetical protein
MGGNARGQIGDGTFQARNDWVRVPFAGRWVAVGAANAASFAIDAHGVLWNWGFIENPGDKQPDFNSRVPNRVPGGPWGQLRPGHLLSAVHASQGSWQVWGPAAENSLGSPHRHLPAPLPTCPDSPSVAVWSSSVLRLDVSGALWICGTPPGPMNATQSETPTGGEASAASPVSWQLLFPQRRWVSIWADGDTALGLDPNGTLWAWGLDLTPPSLADQTLTNLSDWLVDHGINARFGQAGNRWIREPTPVARLPRHADAHSTLTSR